MSEQTMQGLLVPELNRAEVTHVPKPEVADGQVLIKVHYSGISVGTEMWLATGAIDYYQRPPFVAGYQAAGEIVAVGNGVEGLAVGDLVCAFTAGGSHAEYAKASAGLTHKVSSAASLKLTAMFVQPAVGANALNQAGINTGDVVLINGQGLIGQTTAQLAQLRGAYVIGTDVSPDRLKLAERYCVDWAINSKDIDLPAVVKERYKWGVDVGIESTGLQSLIDVTAKCVRAHGRFVFEGHFPGQITYKFMSMHGGQLKCFFPAFIGDPPNREGVIRLIESGRLEMEPLISHTIRPDEVTSIYNGMIIGDRTKYNGIVIDWT
jgi:2-desacetyl-2-hydroxyethyl bacteriochlorophyllide A dehydrogenase